MKKKILFTALFVGLTMSAAAQNEKVLPAPRKSATMTLMDALTQRRSVREFEETEITDQQLSDLLWAACGVNRPEEGKLTVPSAMNAQDITVYVCRKDGAWKYDAKTNSLKKVADKDIRSMTNGRRPAATMPPVVLVLTGDKQKFARIDRDFCDMDGGYVSQNICLTCTAMGLATVPRAGMDRDAIKKALNLAEKEEVILNHPVGYEKKK